MFLSNTTVVLQVLIFILSAILRPIHAAHHAFVDTAHHHYHHRRYHSRRFIDSRHFRKTATDLFAAVNNKDTVQDMIWEQQFQALFAYQTKTGTFDISQRQSKLSKWVKQQQKDRHKMPKERFDKLESIGFWNSPQYCEEEELRQKAATKTKETTSSSHAKGSTTTRKLRSSSSSSSSPKTKSKKNKKNCNVGKKLNRKKKDVSKGRQLGRNTLNWNQRYDELVNYQKQNGNCLVNTRQTQLGHWVCYQRQLYAKGVLPVGRKEKLDAIGFVWKVDLDGPTPTSVWNIRYQELQDVYGSNTVIQDVSPKLKEWYRQQRYLYRKGKLSPHKTKLLESIPDFSWETNSQRNNWESRFQELANQQQTIGSGNKKDHNNNKQLNVWVSNQRQFYKQGNLSQTRVQKLDSIGFVWSMHNEEERRTKFLNSEDVKDPDDSPWMIKLKRLIEYKIRHGNTLVPKNYETDPSLGIWVMNQRRRQNQLSKFRKSKLNAIGFAWNLNEKKNKSTKQTEVKQ